MDRGPLSAGLTRRGGDGLVQEPHGDVGVLPVGADGRPLNLDFETGTLKDWIATGKAFEGQPIKGDTVAARRKDSKSQHQGQFWIGTYGKLSDKPQGTLTSVLFKITHPWASFLVGGGPWPETCVELVLKSPDDDPVLAAWQYGLGRAVAWTPSVESPWAEDWPNWPNPFSPRQTEPAASEMR